MQFTKEQLIAKAREQIGFCHHTKITGEGRTHVNQCSALFEIALAALTTPQGTDAGEHRKAAEQELKPANLVNNFYERYPVASFKSDSERAAALGYFMAGAELQCFGEFVQYEDLYSDE